MTQQDYDDAQATMDVIGRALDRISAAGFPEVHRGLAHYARHARGVIKRDTYPAVKARELLEFARQCEKLADRVAPQDTIIHTHVWKTTGTVDTGHQPPRHEYECVVPGCTEREFTNDPEGPDARA